jgi:hypothetical protein
MENIEIKKENGRFKTLEELWEEAKEFVVDALDYMSNEDALELGNEIRDNNRYDRLYENNAENINDQLANWDPWDLINLEYDEYADFFTCDGYSDIDFTNDIWYDLDTDEIAETILEGAYRNCIPFDLKCYVDEYNRAREKLAHLNPLREAGAVLLAKYTNCEADITDLLQFIDSVARNDEVWEELFTEYSHGM